MIILPYPIREMERELQEMLSLEADCGISRPQRKLSWANSLPVDGSAASFEVAEGKCEKKRNF
jgi:hypothetical protein